MSTDTTPASSLRPLADDLRETRPVLIGALEIAAGKRVERPWKRHGVMPV